MTTAMSNQINSFLISASVIQSNISKIMQNSTINIGVNFANITKIREITGEFTPSNDQKILFVSDPDDAPAMVLFFCNNPANLSITNQNDEVEVYQQVTKSFMMTFTPGNDQSPKTILLDGTTAATPEMNQSTEVSYYLLVVDADVS